VPVLYTPTDQSRPELFHPTGKPTRETNLPPGESLLSVEGSSAKKELSQRGFDSVDRGRFRVDRHGAGTAIAIATAAFARNALPAPVRLQLAGQPDRLWPVSRAERAGTASITRGAVFSGVRTGDQPTVTGLADEDLVRRCQAGDQLAFTEIVERYKDRVCRLVRRMVGSPDDEDITQEVFLRAFQAMPGLRAGATLRTWLFRIAHNLCLTELKRRGRRGAHLSFDEEGEELVHRLLPEDSGREGGRGLEEQLDRREFQSEIRRMVARLPAHYRAVLTLHYLEQTRYEEIAVIMGIPLGTVKTHIHRAKLRLRDLVLAEMDPAHLPEEAPSGDTGEK
jgi:RNA polymerase sigma-70 factor (ECF subfamily)